MPINWRLRELPLFQHWLRGPLQCLDLSRDLQFLKNHDGLPTLRRGPYRVRADSHVLANTGLDERKLLESFNAGLFVIRVSTEVRNDLLTGIVEGDINTPLGWHRIRLKRKPYTSTEFDWRIVRVFSNSHRPRFICMIQGRWETKPDWVSPENSLSAVEGLQYVKRGIEEIIQAKEWKPRTVDARSFVLHIPRRLQETAEGHALGSWLSSNNEKVFAELTEQNQVRLWIETRGLQLIVGAAPFDEATQADLMVYRIIQAGPPKAPLAKLSGSWHPASDGRQRSGAWEPLIQRLRKVVEERSKHNDQADQLKTLSISPMRLCASSSVQKKLDHHGWTLERLAERWSRSTPLLGYSLKLIEDDILPLHMENLVVGIQPDFNRTGPGDWMLTRCHPARPRQAVGFVKAEWAKVSGPPPKSQGNGADLLKELASLIEEYPQVQKKKVHAASRIDGTDTLEERLQVWQKICEFEGENHEYELHRLIGQGHGKFLLEFAETTSEMLRDRLEELEKQNPQGVEWERFPLRLFTTDDDPHGCRLIITGKATFNKQSDVWTLPVQTRGNFAKKDSQKLSELASQSDAVTAGYRLEMKDTQLRRIEEALSRLDPEKDTDDAPLDRPRAEETLRVLLGRSESWIHRLHRLDDPPPLPAEPLQNLSPAQRDAVSLAVHTPDVALIQGPPGTGKTTVILEALRQLFLLNQGRSDFRVLLVAPTHVAVDNVLERLIRPDRSGTPLYWKIGVSFVRLGRRGISDLLKPYVEDSYHSRSLETISENLHTDKSAVKERVSLQQELQNQLVYQANQDAHRWTIDDSANVPLDLATPPTDWPEEWRLQWDTPQGRGELWQEVGQSDPRKRLQFLHDWSQFLHENKEMVNALPRLATNLVAATTIGCSTTPTFRDVTYDVVIVDEAGKEETRRLLVPLVRAERWVLVGDHRQLPPYADSSLVLKVEDHGLHSETVTRTLFEEWEKPLKTLKRFAFLNRQGRMHPDISRFISETFYSRQLEDFPQTQELSRPAPHFLPQNPSLLVLDTRRIKRRHEHRVGLSYANHLEAEIASYLLEHFLGLPDWQDEQTTFGLIAPYRSQVDNLKRVLRKNRLVGKKLQSRQLSVGTVDSFQGQERDWILVCLTRSNRQGKLGFSDNLQRLNVAFSRGRSKLLVIADGATVEKAAQRKVNRDENLSDVEQENRQALKELFGFAKRTGGWIPVPLDWKEANHSWRESSSELDF